MLISVPSTQNSPSAIQETTSVTPDVKLAIEYYSNNDPQFLIESDFNLVKGPSTNIQVGRKSKYVDNGRFSFLVAKKTSKKW